MKTPSLREMYAQVKTQGISMRRRFFLYILSIITSIVLVLLLLLNVFGVLRPADSELERALKQQLDNTADILDNEMEQLAAVAVAFSNELSECIAAQDTPFDELRNDPDALQKLQSDTYNTVYNHMRRAECSGAFYILDTTVNDGLDDLYYDGIYLKYANLSSETTVRNSVRMYRGNVLVARENSVNLHSTWEYETKAGTFPQLEAVLHQSETDPSRGYLLTTVYKLPDSWEQVRFLCTPVTDASGRIIGVCGFEISSMFFKFSFMTADGDQRRAICALLTEDENGCMGQVSGNRSGYAPDLDGALSLGEDGKFATVSNGRSSFIGKIKSIDVGLSSHSVAALLPEGSYLAYVGDAQTDTVLLLLAVAVLAVCVSLWMSRRYVSPILSSMERVKTKQFKEGDAHIPEIDDLFSYLAEQERQNEAALSEIRRERADSQSSLDRLQEEHGKLQERLKQLSQTKKDEVYPEEYSYFLNGISKLSEKERSVFEYYIQGKAVKEVAELLNISEDGVRYHNKNIYATLGVKNLKQLRLFISIMKQDLEAE